jgi:hypothetical protein
MSERLLHFIWRFQYFNKSHFVTTSGESIQVLYPGLYNNDQGPDFFSAKIYIDRTLWAGTVEVHIKSSDWKRHGHQEDSNYNNVILHVVWEDDTAMGNIPVLELKSRVPKVLLERYSALMNTSSFIPCEKMANVVKNITWESWKDRLLAERLSRKSTVVETYLQQNNYHWEETFWWMLARNFGMKVNADAFETIARSVPYNFLLRHRNRRTKLEALMMGRAGLLKEEYNDEYPRLLRKEYTEQYYNLYRGGNNFQDLEPAFLPVWFLRIRPGSFPTPRLAQLVVIVHRSAHLFAKVKEITDLAEVKRLFNVDAGDYWDHHYHFDRKSGYRKKIVGKSMVDNVIINTVVPMLIAYSNYHREDKYREKALLWLEQIIAEKNTIIKGFEKAGIHSHNACDTQSLIELKNEYCNKKRCLECAIGNAILKQ